MVHCLKFNENRSCIEITIKLKEKTENMQFNENRSCIEMSEFLKY